MANPVFSNALVFLSNNIVKEEELDTLRFISSSVLKKNCFSKTVNQIFHLLKNQMYLHSNEFSILCDALQSMGRLDLKDNFLKKIRKQEPIHSQFISPFARMLINVQSTISISKEWESFIFLYSYEKRGAGIKEESVKGSVYKSLQYLLDKDILSNDKVNLKKFQENLESSQLIQAKNYLDAYLNKNPNLPESQHSSSSPDAQTDGQVGNETSMSANINPVQNNQNLPERRTSQLSSSSSVDAQTDGQVGNETSVSANVNPDEVSDNLQPAATEVDSDNVTDIKQTNASTREKKDMVKWGKKGISWLLISGFLVALIAYFIALTFGFLQEVIKSNYGKCIVFLPFILALIMMLLVVINYYYDLVSGIQIGGCVSLLIFVGSMLFQIVNPVSNMGKVGCVFVVIILFAFTILGGDALKYVPFFNVLFNIFKSIFG